ncbi:MAG TPA: hypothetical protein VMG12_26275, partial [Polyangiaceae bacterium]|nr:hypothetical protein [Polyangiaceae bacterium]
MSCGTTLRDEAQRSPELAAAKTASRNASMTASSITGIDVTRAFDTDYSSALPSNTLARAVSAEERERPRRLGLSNHGCHVK